MISPILYNTIAQACNSFITSADAVNTEMDAMVSALTDSTVTQSRVLYLQDQIAQSRPAQTTSQFQQAVFQLQTMIAAESGSVDQYLTFSNLQVPPLFASLSIALGFPISDANIS